MSAATAPTAAAERTGRTQRTQRAERRPLPPASARFRLSPRTRKVLLLTHIAAAGAWLGIDLVLGVLVFTAFTATAVQSAVAAASLASFATWPLITVGLVTLVIGGAYLISLLVAESRRTR